MTQVLQGEIALVTGASRGIGAATALLAAAGLDVFGQHLHAAHQILAVLGQGLAQQLRVGRDEIRGGEGPGDLLDVEARPVAGVRVEVLGLLDHALGPA